MRMSPATGLRTVRMSVAFVEAPVEAAVRYLEAIEGGGGYRVKALPARRRRAKAR